MLETPSGVPRHPNIPLFEVAVLPNRSQVVVAPRGELDLLTAEDLGAQLDDLRAAGFREILLDLRGITFLDSTGLRVLLAQARAARDGDCRLRLVQGPSAVRRIFELTGTVEHFDFVVPGPR